jgi:hypothetical protein
MTSKGAKKAWATRKRRQGELTIEDEITLSRLEREVRDLRIYLNEIYTKLLAELRELERRIKYGGK